MYGPNKASPTKVIPTAASVNFAIIILDIFIQPNQKVMV